MRATITMITTLIFVLLYQVTVAAQETEWQNLLDKELTHWDTYIGVLHHTVKGIDDVPKGDGKKGIALGLNNDPLKVFYAADIDGTTILRVSGEVFGGLTSKEVYKNYHLKLEFKWGELKWEPRLTDVRDNGILYHCNGEHGAFWNVWMQAQEFQIQENDMGDYYGLSGAINSVNAARDENGFFKYNPKEETVVVGSGVSGENRYRCVRSENHEKPHGEWNTLELICFNGKSYHIVNGQLVMVLNAAKRKVGDELIPVTSGKIQLQSEAAEAYYKNVMLKKITELPDAVKGL